MTAAQLIALLATMPPDLPVGFVNECADDGATFVEVTEIRHKSRSVSYSGYNHAPQEFPRGEAGALVLA